MLKDILKNVGKQTDDGHIFFFPTEVNGVFNRRKKLEGELMMSEFSFLSELFL